METPRFVAIAAIATGFAVTAVAGFVLASSNLPLSAIFVRAFVVFLIVLPLFAVGVNYYIRTTDVDTPGVSQTELQRRMLDLLHLEGSMSFQELAIGLQITEAEVNTLIQDLVALELFMGEIDWSTGMVYQSRHNALPDSSE